MQSLDPVIVMWKDHARCVTRTKYNPSSRDVVDALAGKCSPDPIVASLGLEAQTHKATDHLGSWSQTIIQSYIEAHRDRSNERH